MFIRKDNRIDVTIFDVSNSSILSKKEMYDQAIQMHEESLKSATDIKTTTRIVMPTIFSYYNTEYIHSTSCSRKALFNDILGRGLDVGEKEWGDTRIVNKRISTDRKPQKRRAGMFNTQVKENDALINDTKAYDLMHKYNKNTLKRSGLNVTSSANIDKASARGYDYYLYDDSTPKRNTFKEEDSELHHVDRVLIIDTVYTISELPLLIDQMYDLSRMCDNSLNRMDYLNIYRDLTRRLTQRTLNRELLGKYGIKDSRTWNRLNKTNTGIGSEYGTYYKKVFDSVHEENEATETLTSNVFIPVTYIFFLQKSNGLFMTNDSIIKESHVIKNPQFFVDKTPISETLGFPSYKSESFIHNDKGKLTFKVQTHTSILPELTTSNFDLKTTLTSIPSSLAERLLKSKLKAVNNYATETKQYEHYMYDIPKSILESDLMSSFHFFNKDQVNQITFEQRYHNHFFYYKRVDGRIDLSYYTKNINAYLINRFASTFYGSNINIDDIIISGEIMFKSGVSLEEQYSKLENRQKILAEKFNDSKETILTENMFLYEKTNLLFMYLLKKTNHYICMDPKNRTGDSSFNRFKILICNNNYIFKKESIDAALTSDIKWLEINSVHKAHLYEYLFVYVKNHSKEEILKKIQDVLTGFITTIENDAIKAVSTDKLVDIFIELVSKRGPVHNIFADFYNRFYKLVRVHTSVNATLLDIVSRGQSEDYILKIVHDVSMTTYLDNIMRIFSCLSLLIRLFVESNSTYVIDEKGKSYDFLLNSPAFARAHQNFYMYYGGREYQFEFIKNSIVTNSTSTKIDSLEIFTKLLINNFSKEYFGTLKKDNM